MPEQVGVAVELPKAETPNLQELLRRRDSIDKLLNITWQRRMMAETLMATPDTSSAITQTAPATINRLFPQTDIQSGQVVEGSDLAQLLATKQATDTEKVTAVEKYLLKKALADYPPLHDSKLSSFPADVFARPEDENSLAQAIDIVAANSDKPVDTFLGEELGKRYLPFLETILEAEWNGLTAKVGIEVLSDPKQASEYYEQWIKDQKNSPDRITFSPTYREIARECHTFMRRNGKNRTIARSLLYGPPGQGKTEFYRALNRRDEKPTMVISARPHLGYEELVAAVQIVSKDQVSTYAELTNLYAGLDSESVVTNLRTVSQEVASKQAGNIDFTQRESASETLRSLQMQWLIEIAGLTPQMADAVSKSAPPATPSSGSRYIGEGLTTNNIKDAFRNHLVQKATHSLFESEESTKYLRGLILTADRLGMRVIIDEAEKMYKGGPGESPSFGGLEDILTRQPGSTVRIGDIEHRFSDDFCIDLSMNEMNIPPHIRSRFGERAFLMVANPYDRVAISAVGIANQEGQPGLSSKAQENLIFFSTFAWDAIADAASLNGEPFDLRLLQTTISALVHDGRPQNKTVAAVLSAITHEHIRQTIARFQGLRPHLDFGSRLQPQEAPLPPEDTNQFVKALINGPEAVASSKSLTIADLSPTEVERLAHPKTDEETSLPSDTQVDSLSCRISLRGQDTDFPKLIFASKVDSDIIFDGSFKLEAKPIKPLKIQSASSWGTTVLIRDENNGTRYFALDAAGNLSGAVAEDPTDRDLRKISPSIDNPVDIKLTPSGDYIYYITQSGNLACQPLGLVENDKHKLELLKDFAIEIPGVGKPAQVKIDRSGNYALVKCDNHDNYLLDLRATQQTGQAMLLTTTPLPGENWDLSTFQNTLYLFNGQDKKGFRIS